MVENPARHVEEPIVVSTLPSKMESRRTSIDTDCGIMTWQRTIVERLLPRDVCVVWVDYVNNSSPRGRCQRRLVDLHVAGDVDESSE